MSNEATEVSDGYADMSYVIRELSVIFIVCEYAYQ